MLLTRRVLLTQVFCCLVWFSVAYALPAQREQTICSYEDDDCREKFMHPVMPAATSAMRKSSSDDTIDYWLENGLKYVQDKVKSVEQPQRGVAKNIIFFLGDGMSLATLAATRIYMGGAEQKLSFENFPHTGLAKTYALDRLIADSACTATAFLCGVKTRYGTIGVNGHVERGHCAAGNEAQNQVESIATWALQAGKSVGFVTTSRVTHATPAPLYAHVSDRDWENDAEVKQDCGSQAKTPDIAQQLITGVIGKQLKVIMGGGKEQFLSTQQGGKRQDGRNLIEEFLAQPNTQFIENKQQLSAASTSKRLLGLFNDSHMDYNLQADNSQQPTLSEMVAKAMSALESNTKGYLLFVENGKIDEAHHSNWATLALDETAELSAAVELARERTSQSDTLIVVSSDHSHTMSMAGYAERGSDIIGYASSSATDGLPYMTLSYANGPSYDYFFDTKNSKRINPDEIYHSGNADIFPATVPLFSETHGGDDVAVYASGPWSHLFTGAYEQSVLPHLIAYASCIGTGQKACEY